MCRLMIFSGHQPMLLSNLITLPTHSILKQSYDSHFRLGDQCLPPNGDGFGVGYYTASPISTTCGHCPDDFANTKKGRIRTIDLGPEPCIFTSTTPAWSCRNLKRLTSKAVSRLAFAHVRASTMGGIGDANCHPFSRGALMWMHNGQIGGWRQGVKRKLTLSIGDRWYQGVDGNTDSEWAFALFLDSLESLGVDPDDEETQRRGFGHARLQIAMLRTIQRINGFTAEIPTESGKGKTKSFLNFAVSDGKSVVCTRYVTSHTEEAASLFFSSGTDWTRNLPGCRTQLENSHPDAAEFRMEGQGRGSDVVLVASEPLTSERNDWVMVPTNSILTISQQRVSIDPVLDQYHDHTCNESAD